MLKFTTFLSTAVSCVLTVLLFASIGTTPFMIGLFGCMGFIIEFSKFTSFVEVLKTKNVAVFGLFVTLTALSIFASIGAMQSNVSKEIASNTNYNEQKAFLHKQLEMKQNAYETLIKMERVTKAQPLMIEQQEIQNQINALVKPTSNVTGLIETLTTITELSTDTVTSFVYVLVAVILDACALFLLFMITEKRSETFHNDEQQSVKQEQKTPKVLDPTQQTEMIFSETTTRSLTVRTSYQDVLDAIQNGDIKPSIRGVMAFKSIGYTKANKIMKSLVDTNHLVKTNSGRYELSRY